ncbi:endonuclease [Longibacter salinarum]|uniref:Endonuclease n=1 Tax=Longibacter salinarum TaxID=1850348 RepID=A0A2A8D001_9BACT|nr:endonuclease/exonuclease/phosphatase family protein [Longibacter salinarum]PEN14265.1 endonuclease [Longibacter salinarum]
MTYFWIALHVVTVSLGLSMAVGTALSLSRHPHWFIRGWDFPRPLIASLAAISGIIFMLRFYNGGFWDIAFLAVMGLTVAWQIRRIAPYLPVMPRPVDWARRPRQENTLRIVSSNVMQENEGYQTWIDVVRAADPDVILALEVDAEWEKAMLSLRDDYPHVVAQPQDNYYGMMLLSRLPLVDPEIRTLVEDDVPSLKTQIEMRNGQTVTFYGVHPRPPEPIRDNHAEERDAEVVLLGREMKEVDGSVPTVVAGDFNDVAWSHTTDLFIQLSGLLDPRKGRGIFNTFHAEYPIFRFPLDHIFHSNHFKLVNLQLLDYVGSDHFPVCTELHYEWRAPEDQPEPEPSSDDVEEAQEKVERAAESQH